MSKQSALDKLNSFLDSSSPKLSTFLARNWKNQQQAITYKEIRTAIQNGELDMKYLLQWQQDYSKFVLKYYYPLAQKAIETSAQALLGQYGGALLDPSSGLIDNFIQNYGGQLIREISVTQFGAINTLVRQAALSDTMSVDQLAKAIRPCIGLTQRQAQATMHYYDNLIKQGYTHKEAAKMQATYAERMHRHRAATIAQTELAFAYNQGQYDLIQESIQNGLIQPGVTKKWYTAADERVCDECGKLDMEEVPLTDSFSNGVMLPPAHPNCRCTVGYENLQTPVQQPAQAAQGAQTAAATSPDPADPNYNPPTIPESIQSSEYDYHYKGNQQMGTGEMYQYEDLSGDEYIFKPAQTKQGVPEPFRAYIQEAGYKVQYIIDPDSSVPVTTLSVQTPKGKKFGAMQQTVTDLDPSFNLKAWQGGYGTQPTPEIIAQLQRENVTDWLLCNYDSHGGNFLLTNSGQLIGVDKEQAFRYLSDKAAQKMSYTFSPNTVKYGETEPIYNTIYRKFAHGEIDIDLNNTLTYIKRIEAIPDSEYREIFREYAEAMHGKGAQAEKLLDNIVARKQTVRSTFESFYSELLTERKGVPTVFQFADTATAAATAPLNATTFSSTSLKGMSIKDLKTIAKQQGIKYVSHMTKDELVLAVSDPTQTTHVMDTAKARAAANAQNRAARAAQAAAATPPTTAGRQIDGITQLADAAQDFDVALQGSNIRGVSLISDSSSLEGMQTTLRKVTIDGEDFYELNGKLTHDRWVQANKDMWNSSMSGKWQFNEAVGKIDYTSPALNLSGSSVQRMGTIDTQFIRRGDDIIVLTGRGAENDARAMMGEFNIRVKAANGRDAGQKVQELLRQAGMGDIMDDVSPAALDRYKKMRLIWQNDPATAATLDPIKSTDAQISGVLNRLGITQARVDKVHLKKVTDGYFTFVDDFIETEMKDKGVAYLWHGIRSAESAASVIESGELISTTHRMKRGIFGAGASPDCDIQTGGADNVFARIVMNKQVGRHDFSDSPLSGTYHFVFDRKVLTRTDWYAYTGDNFGTTEGSTFTGRRGIADHFAALNKRYNNCNEVMLRKSVGLSDLKEIRCDDTFERQALIDALRHRGVNSVNGKPIESIIKVRSEL